MSTLPNGPGRLILDTPRPGAWNMAADEVLLDNAAEGSLTLRFYGWSDPTLSLGYFQTLASRASHQASRLCTLVRRASGGGALVHDDFRSDLTYSVAVPDPLRLAVRQRELYRVMHLALVDVLRASGVAARRHCQPTIPACGADSPIAASPQSHDTQQPTPFLCFQRHTDGDVLIGGHKVLGSAQRRDRGALLQHGSLLLQSTPAAPELPGVMDLANPISAGLELANQWIEALQRIWPIDWSVTSWTAGEIQRIQALIDDKFSAPDWTAKR